MTGRAECFFRKQLSALYRRTDRLFAILMVLQWIAGVTAALWISPRTWAGTQSETHPHVWAAVLLGGILTSFPICLAFLMPGAAVTRQVIAVAQMLWSALLIHLTGGRIETHFHIFGSLAFLAFYRDWRVLVTATVVVALDHGLRGLYWPQSVYGVLLASPWRSLEHGAWVVFEDVFLCIAILQSLNERRDIAIKQGHLEQSSELLEAANCSLRAEINEREQTEDALGERAVQAALGADVGLAFTGSSSLQEMLRHCVESMVPNLDAAFARIWTINQENDTLELQASAGMYTHIDGPHSRVPVGKFKIGLIAEEKKPYLTNEVGHDPAHR